MAPFTFRALLEFHVWMGSAQARAGKSSRLLEVAEVGAGVYMYLRQTNPDFVPGGKYDKAKAFEDTSLPLNIAEKVANELYSSLPTNAIEPLAVLIDRPEQAVVVVQKYLLSLLQGVMRVKAVKVGLTDGGKVAMDISPLTETLTCTLLVQPPVVCVEVV